MRLLRHSLLLAALLGTLGFGLAPAAAVAAPALETNLLKNASFESALSDWAPYYVPGPSGCGGQQPVTETIAKSVDSRRVHAGDNAAKISISGGKSYQAGLQQTVTGVTPGSRLRFTMWGHVWSTSVGNDPTKSDSGLAANLKVGIGQGLTYAADPGVTWSPLAQIFDNYQQLSVEATATGNSLTVFVMSNPSACNNWNDTYWDDGSLTVVSGAAAGPTGTAGTTAPKAPTLGVAPTKFPTPTPGAEGNIVYIVQPGDTMWRVAAIAGLTVEQLKALNGLNTDVVIVGQKLILGSGNASAPEATATAPANEPTATAVPSGEQPTATAPAAEQPSVTPVVGGGGTPVASAATGEVCVMLYEDGNGDGTRGAGEGLLAGGQFKLIDAGSGSSTGNYTTDAANEPHCFQNLATGNYSVEVTMPTGYNATTATTFALPLTPGGTANLEFGAQAGTGASGGGTASSSRLRTALFGAAGIIFLLLAAGVAGFLVLTQRGRRS